MRSIFNASVPLTNVIVLPAINNRVGSFHATKNDETLSFAMAQNETEPGSGVYGWGENFRVKALSFVNDPLLCSGLIPGITQREQVKALYLDQLNTRWSNFKAMVNAPNIRDEARTRATDVLEAFEALHTKDGAIVEPDWESAVVTIEGHHRLLGHCLELAYAYCKAEGKVFNTEIPVSCVEFPDIVSLRLAQTMGNGASAAHNPLSDLDLVGMGVDFVPTGMSETKFRHITGKDSGSTGRRAYLIAKLHHICAHRGIDVFGALKLFYNVKAEKDDETARKTPGAVPLDALHNDAKDASGNVASILRLIGSLKDLDDYVAKKNSDANEWEKEAHASRTMWDNARLQEWWKTRQPAANNGVVVSMRKVDPKPDKDFIRVCKEGLKGEIGKLFHDLLFSTTEQRATMSEEMFLAANGIAINASVLLLKNAITAPVYREFVTELEAAANAVPEQVASLIADFRDQLRQTAAKAAAETAETVDTTKVGTAPTTDSTVETAGKSAKGKAKAGK